MHNKLKIDDGIFCIMVRHYGKTFNLPPLAAKIYSYLIFDFDRNGLAFDDLVDTFNASKSSVSTNLNLLISNKLINDINKLDERKRYFVINEDFIKLRFQEILDKLKEEIKILDALRNFNTDQPQENIERSKAHRAILISNIMNIENSLDKL